jgi:Mg-chelatase subunit ChlD
VSIAALCEVAEDAAGVEPDSARLASPGYLDELGAGGGTDVAAALKNASGTIEELLDDVERRYKLALQ